MPVAQSIYEAYNTFVFVIYVPVNNIKVYA